MTAAVQPRDEGGRFASPECPTTYRLLVDAQEVAPREGVSGRWYRVEAPRCPHGHFARWAAANCKRCR